MMNPLLVGSKTPVSILQEMCVRKGCTPHYDLILNGGGTHEALFKYKVEASGVSAIGTGRSKKEAKHDAARNALERLAKDENESPELVVPEDVLDVASPYRDKIQENAVGALQDLCTVNDCPQPEYKLIAEGGLAHARRFTFQCSVSKHKEIGEARTKKQAKQLAASRMLRRLKALPNMLDGSLMEKKPEDSDRNEKTKEVEAKFLEITGGVLKQPVPMKVPLSDYHLSLTTLPEEIIDNFLAKRETPRNNSSILNDGSGDVESREDDLSLLEELLKELEIEFSFVEFEALPSIGKVFDAGSVDDDDDDVSSAINSDLNEKNEFTENKLVVLQLDTNPLSVLYGSGYSLESAKVVAATNALNYLDIMCRKKPMNAAVMTETN